MPIHMLALALVVCLGAAIAPARAAETRVYWGDTHLHTSYSFDVYLFGTVAATPDTAYRFARGLPVVSPVTQTRWQLSRPLDFLVVADHAEALGSMLKLYSDDPTFTQTRTGKLLLEIGGSKKHEDLLRAYQLLSGTMSGLANPYGVTPKDFYVDLHGGEKRRSAWSEIIDAAERYNQPGVFTALIGWEWGAQPGGANLHRVVFTPQGGAVARQFLPFSYMESGDPEDLWRWLGEVSGRTGAQFLAIPHNANVSDGRMFPLMRANGQPIDAAYAKARQQWEPVVEVTQIKGDSETHPALSPTDEFAEYETYNFIMTPEGRKADANEADYIRSGLRRGLALEATKGPARWQSGPSADHQRLARSRRQHPGTHLRRRIIQRPQGRSGRPLRNPGGQHGEPDDRDLYQRHRRRRT